MTWMAQPMTWILLGVAGGVVLGLICIIWATQGRPLSENPHHDEF
jgi:ABC-type lipoprotein release transport system permease subunit